MRHVSKAPSTLTAAETKALLDATSRSDDDLRDHMVLSIALETGLRVSELVALNVGDVATGKGAKGVWTLRAETTKGGRGGSVALPEKLRRKVSRVPGWTVERTVRGDGVRVNSIDNVFEMITEETFGEWNNVTAHSPDQHPFTRHRGRPRRCPPLQPARAGHEFRFSTAVAPDEESTGATSSLA